MPQDLLPEQKTRKEIDKMLVASGWVVLSLDELDWKAGPGIAITEYSNDKGRADYALFVDKKVVGILEAKAKDQGQNLTTVEEQSERYAKSKLKNISDTSNLHFIYESTGVITRFRDARDPKPRSREVFSFHRPETIRNWLNTGKSIAASLHDLPVLDAKGLRDCQVNAITNLDESFKKNKPPGAHPNGNRFRQNLHRHYLYLPPAKVCQSQTGTVSGRHQKPR